MPDQPMSTPPSTQRPGPSFLATVVLSLVIGGLAGGIVGAGVLETQRSGSLLGAVKQSVAVKEESATVDVVSKTNPAVVSLIITKDYSKIYGDQSQLSPFGIFGWPFTQPQVPQGKQEVGGGSGFIVTSDGMIVTNRHVVDDTQAEYSVVMNNGQKYDAKVVAKDPVNDVAIVKIEAKNLPTLDFADSDSVDIGQTVIAIGNALGEYRNTVTKGIISGKSRTIQAGDNSSGQSETLEDVFQTDAAINPGNSGGPLLDLSGRVIAINTAVNSSGQLIGFAIPANVVKRDLDSVRQTGKISTPYIGVRYVVITKAMAEQQKLAADHGALVQASGQDAAVVKDSPADKAGLQDGDIILSVNGKDLTTDHTLAGAIAKYNVGDSITLKVNRKGTTKDYNIVLEERK
jgi:serine protease Do